MEKIRNLSVRKTILLYIAIAIFCSFFLSAWIVRIADRTQIQIWRKYLKEETYPEMVRPEDRPAYPGQDIYEIPGQDIYEIPGQDIYGIPGQDIFEIPEPDNFKIPEPDIPEIPRPHPYEMTLSDLFLSEFCDFLQTYTILLLSMAGICIAVFFFYRDKIKRPTEELERASKNIAMNNLDFHITYENRDEMGRLCREFERMKEQLAENNRILWKNIEEEKALRAAIAHDIRSPLSVLRGYQEMLLEYLPGGAIDIDEAMKMLAESMAQIDRMDDFVETMRSLSSLEERRLNAGEITADRLRADIQAELDILEKKSGKRIVLQVLAANEIFCGDKEIILEVTENLLSNALRYAEQQVEIIVKEAYSELKICVRDDGTGFQESAEEITKPFHQQNVKDSLKHTGMGMYISRLYCEKHGGELILENDGSKGAVVIAIFHRIA